MPTQTAESRNRRRKKVRVNGRDYFAEAARELHLQDKTAVTIWHESEQNLKAGRAESKLGGLISGRDLVTPDDDDAARRDRESREFLSQPVKHFSSEETGK